MENNQIYPSFVKQALPDFTKKNNADPFIQINQISDEKSDEDVTAVPSLRQKWTVPEDQLLVQLVNIHGTNYWPSIAQMLPGRNGKQCRERWMYHLNPSIKKGEWTEREDSVITSMQKVLGTQWSKISKLLPGRSDGNVKNRFYALERIRMKTLAKENISSMSDPLSQLAAAAMLMPTLKKSAEGRKNHSSSALSSSSSSLAALEFMMNYGISGTSGAGGNNNNSSGHKRSRSSSTETDNETGTSEHTNSNNNNQQQKQDRVQDGQEVSSQHNETTSANSPSHNQQPLQSNLKSHSNSRNNSRDDHDEDEVLTYVPQKKRLVITSAFTPSSTTSSSNQSSSSSSTSSTVPLPSSTTTAAAAASYSLPSNFSAKYPNPSITGSNNAVQSMLINNQQQQFQLQLPYNKNNAKNNTFKAENIPQSNSNSNNNTIHKSISKPTAKKSLTTSVSSASNTTAQATPSRNVTTALELRNLANYNGSKTWVPVQASNKNLDSFNTHFNNNNNNNNHYNMNNSSSLQFQQLCQLNNQYTALTPNPLFFSDMKIMGNTCFYNPSIKSPN